VVNQEFNLLCSKAWSIQILAYMLNENDARISPITHYFAASRTSISAALEHLIQLKYLRKNAGHGHPLRPAYVLTKKGRAVAEWAVELDKKLKPDDWIIARRTWTLPIIRQVYPERRYVELRSSLNPITDRALSETLKVLGKHQWLNRHVDANLTPPSVTYIPQGTGATLVPVLEESLKIYA